MSSTLFSTTTQDQALLQLQLDEITQQVEQTPSPSSLNIEENHETITLFLHRTSRFSASLATYKVPEPAMKREVTIFERVLSSALETQDQLVAVSVCYGNKASSLIYPQAPPFAPLVRRN